jgi:hypothetical protein
MVEYRQTLLDDLVAARAVDVGDETDAAGVVLVERLVEPFALPVADRPHDATS